MANHTSVVSDPFTCHDCPYGGVCDGSIVAKDNYWGVEDQKEIEFIQCPEGYCCKNCTTFNECAPNRYGALCGKCKDGFSEALFSSKCVPDKTCNNTWFWPLFLVYGIFYVFVFLLYISEISSIFSSLLFGSGSEMKQDVPLPLDDQNENHDAYCNQSAKSFMKIAFHYFQVAQNLHVSLISPSTATDPPFQSIQKYVLNFFNFGLVQFTRNICPFPGLNALLKLLFKACFVVYVFLLLLVIWILYKILATLLKGVISAQSVNESIISQDTVCEQRNNTSVTDHPLTRHHAEHNPTFSTRIWCGVILAGVLTYQSMSKLVFNLLDCITLTEHSGLVLFLKGDINCYASPWQYVVLLYTIFCLFPFGFYLVFGTKLLKQGRISFGVFMASFFFPVPCLLYSFYLHVSSRTKTNNRNRYPITHETRHMLSTLGASTDPSTTDYWVGLPVTTRFLIVFFKTFISNSVLKSCCMFAVCCGIFILHTYMKKCHYGKRLNKLVLYQRLVHGMLTVLSFNSVIQATFLAAQLTYKSSDPNVTTVHILAWVKVTLVDVIPILVVSCLALAVVVRIVCRMVTSIVNQCRKLMN